MSNSSNSINIAAAATAAEAVISWRDASPRNEHSCKTGIHARGNERKDAAVKASISSSKDCKKRNATDNITEECKSTEEVTRSDRNFKLSAAGTDESTCEELSSCGEEILCLTPTKDGIGRNVPNVSPLRNYFVKPELWETISMNCIELNEKAKKLYNGGQNDAALEALYSAEGQRQKLVDLVQSERYAQLYCQIVHHSGKDASPPLFPLLLDHSSIDNINIPEDKVEEEKRNYIYQRSDFDEGMRVFEDMESIRKSYFSVADSQSNFVQVCPAAEAAIKFNIGQVLHRQGDLEGASKCYEDAMAVLQHTVSATATHEILTPILHNLGYAMYRRGDILQAKKLYSDAYDNSIQNYGYQHPHVASALNCLGVLHYHSNSAEPKDDDDTKNIDSSFAKAMECFKEALSILDDLGSEKDAERATVLNNCGRLHVQNDEYDTALVYYTQALHIRRDCLGPNSLDYAATAFNAGQCYHQKGRLDDANDLYQEFLRVALMKYGRGHRDVAVVLSGMAQIFQEKHQYDQALELYEESLSAGREALGDDHTEIAMLYNRLGNFNFERGRLEDALKCYLQGLAIEKKVLSPSHPNILVTLSNLGEIYRQSKQWIAAVDTFSECLEILRRKHGDKDHEEVAKMLETLGLVTDQRGDSSLALKYLRDSLSMKRKIARNRVDLSATLVYIATILSRRRDFPGAMECLTEALQIRESALGRNCRDVAFVLYNIGLIHQQGGRYEAAIESYKDTLLIEKAVLGERHRDIALTLLKLGEANLKHSNFDAALKYFEEYMSIMSEISERGDTPSRSDQASMARTLNEIGNIYLARGDTRSMMEALNEASRLFRQAGLSPNNVVVNGGHLFALDLLPEAAPAA